jgi:hypothetical protein
VQKANLSVAVAGWLQKKAPKQDREKLDKKN